MAARFHNQSLCALASDDYSPAQLARIRHALQEHGTLEITALPTGLYRASSVAAPGRSGYDNVWVRDNIYVAHARWQSGHPQDAVAVAASLLSFYSRYRHRFTATSTSSVMGRPHVRFDGLRLQEISEEQWPHAQNDALGYCLWLCARLAVDGQLRLDAGQLDTLARLAQYFPAIHYWQDEDSGHWEETRRISASSIGVVVAGLRVWRTLLDGSTVARAADWSRTDLIASADAAIGAGQRALDAILPAECTQPSPRQHRQYDAALLFLVHPLAVVPAAIADAIIADVQTHLQGEVGIRRYLGDSYWAPDYDRRLTERDLTRDYSQDIETRDALLERAGDEAQWCLFDPILSALYGRRFLTTGNADDRAAQASYFTRALAQITSDWRCPELYYWRDGALTSNPHTPLAWTQANLTLALAAMEATTGAS
jgi:GH15 family glucan-1,4-alpha-glucosidase